MDVFINKCYRTKDEQRGLVCSAKKKKSQENIKPPVWLDSVDRPRAVPHHANLSWTPIKPFNIGPPSFAFFLSPAVLL
jgi:hypothetical protein